MDELKLMLNTKFMRNIVTKILAKAIYKKTGYHVDIQLNEIIAETSNGKIKLHMNIDTEMHSEDFANILKTIDVL